MKVVEASEVAFVELELACEYSAELTHGHLTAEGKAEAYNQASRDSYTEKQTKLFLKLNPGVGKQFNQKETDLNDDGEEEFTENKMFLMNRKTLSQGLLNHETKCEIERSNPTSKVKFGPRKVGGKHVTFKESRKQYFQMIDVKRQTELYSHVCYAGCKKRGCEKVSTFDGLWKISFAICMWDCSSAYPSAITEYVPQCCPNEPENGKAFCDSHSQVVEKLGKPSGLRPFLESCGVKGENINKEEKKGVDCILKEMAAKSLVKEPGGRTAGEEQGTERLLRKCSKDVKNFEVVKNNEEECRKDVGENVRLRRYSRGYLAACSGGGHIWSFDPLFKSEGPVQVSLLMLKYLMKRLAKTDQAEWNGHFLNYDNICNLDRLKLLRNPLPLPAPFSTVWKDVRKVIDPLHIKNHKNPNCHIEYSSEKLKSELPDVNLMVAEQTFSWLGKFKKILNSMPKYNQLFLLHRLVQRRNEYTQYCYSIGAKPMLPSVKASKNK